jgi:hypothetical protein
VSKKELLEAIYIQPEYTALSGALALLMPEELEEWAIANPNAALFAADIVLLCQIL